MVKRYEAMGDGSWDWYVYDNEACYCVAGPLIEHDAITMAIELNEKAGASQ